MSGTRRQKRDWWSLNKWRYLWRKCEITILSVSWIKTSTKHSFFFLIVCLKKYMLKIRSKIGKHYSLVISSCIMKQHLSVQNFSKPLSVSSTDKVLPIKMHKHGSCWSWHQSSVNEACCFTGRGGNVRSPGLRLALGFRKEEQATQRQEGRGSACLSGWRQEAPRIEKKRKSE